MSKINKVVAAAVLAMGASAAQAGIIIPAGDWTIDISGNVNTYYNHTSCDDNVGPAIGGGLACNISPSLTGSDSDVSSVRTGLLPAFLSFSGKTRQNDLDIGFLVSLQPGTATGRALATTDQENRQTYLTVGDKSWGSFKFGRDIGLFGADGLLSDQTILGTGSSFAGGNYRAGSNQGGGTNVTSGTSLGRIGIGYIYADWIAQISYTSPNWDGFSFGLGVVEPYQAIALASDFAANGGSQRDYSTPGFQGKVSYEWAGDVNGKVWGGFWYQAVDGIVSAAGTTDQDAIAFDIGGKVSYEGLELVGYYYHGDGVGTTGFLVDAFDRNGEARESDGGYIQLGYKLPGVGTKLAVSYGESNLDSNGAIDNAVVANATTGALSSLVKKNSSWVVGAYHPLTKSLNIVAEYTHTESEAQNSSVATVEEDNVSLGAILFF